MDDEKELTFDAFSRRAKDTKLSPNEKIGFPDDYRQGFEDPIFEDIAYKLQLEKTEQNACVMDIGCGCSGLTNLIIKHAQKNHYKLILIDSEEMLENIADYENVEKVNGCFPQIEGLFRKYCHKATHILIYSVMQYVFYEGNIYDFIHKAIDLLAPGGRLLIGDIPNEDKRDRFLASEPGQAFLNNQDRIETSSAQISRDKTIKIDDSIVLSILSRYRKFDCEAYLLPQNPMLPMANRREDVLIVKR